MKPNFVQLVLQGQFVRSNPDQTQVWTYDNQLWLVREERDRFTLGFKVSPFFQVAPGA